MDASLRVDDAADDAADADEGGGENDDAYEGFKVAELQHILRARELAVTGTASSSSWDSFETQRPLPQRPILLGAEFQIKKTF